MDEKELREIERMVRDYYPNETASSECIQDSIAKGGYANIVALYDKGYRKIPEGAVVLSKEDLQKYAKDCIIGEVAGYDILKAAFARAERWRDEARKETAREIFCKLLREAGDTGNGFLPNTSGVLEWTYLSAWIKQLAQQYGVEVGL